MLILRVSYYQMSVDNGPIFKQKSSGIIICTGNVEESIDYSGLKKLAKIVFF